MFPEIVREDIFRLETRRLWLRWPMPGDAGSPGFPPGRDSLPEAATGDPYEASSIETLRRDNEAGVALHLVLHGRGGDRHPIGRLSLVPVRERLENCGLRLSGSLDPAHHGRGLMTEAVQAVADAAFMLTDTPLLAASARVRDPGFRRVLEKCGFSYCGQGLDMAEAAGGLIASDRFRLDRKAWASLKSWRVPGVVRGRGREAVECRPGP